MRVKRKVVVTLTRDEALLAIREAAFKQIEDHSFETGTVQLDGEGPPFTSAVVVFEWDPEAAG